MPIIFRYLISGGSAAATLFALLAFLHEALKISPITASTIAFCAAVVVSFTLQKFWTFQDKNSSLIKKQFLLYFIFTLINLTINGGLMYFFIEIVGLWYLFAQFLSAGSIALYSFFIYKRFIFN